MALRAADEGMHSAKAILSRGGEGPRKNKEEISMAIEFKDGKYVDPQTGRVTLDPTVYKDWQIAEEA